MQRPAPRSPRRWGWARAGSGDRASVMIEKFAGARSSPLSEFLDPNHTSNSMILVSLMIPKFAPEPSIERRRTSESGHYCGQAARAPGGRFAHAAHRALHDRPRAAEHAARGHSSTHRQPPGTVRCAVHVATWRRAARARPKRTLATRRQAPAIAAADRADASSGSGAPCRKPHRRPAYPAGGARAF
jgi:hypothetical protein